MQNEFARGGVAAGLFLFASVAAAAPFTPGNVVVYRTGNGVSVPNGVAVPVFLDEVAVPGGGIVQSVAMPTSLSGASKPLVASGSSATDGMLTRSADGNCLAVPGYGRDVSVTANNLTTVTGVPRIVGRVNTLGSVDTTTAIADLPNAPTNFRSAASSDCASFWVAAGNGGGVRYTTLGSATSTGISGTFASMRVLSIFGGQLYVSTPLAAALPVATVGTGLPASGTQTVARIPGLTAPAEPAGFFLADLDAGVAGVDTAYIADETAGTITKLSKVGAAWVSNGTVGGGTQLYRGVAGTVSGASVTLFATRNANAAVMIVDANGYNAPFAATLTSLAAAGANNAFRGIALAPEVTVTASAGPNGSITPATQVVGGGARAEFTVTANPGYSTVVGGTCLGGMIDAATYKTDPVSVNCSVVATFTSIPTFTATPIAAPHGTIAPSAPQTLLVGATTSFTITPDAGYSFEPGGTCPGTMSGSVFTLAPIAADCTVTATFTLITRTVTPSATANGAITPDSPQVIPLGTTAAFNVLADFGFQAAVGGTCGVTRSGTTYTTLPVNADCTVEAIFTPLPRYNVTPLTSGRGSVSPAAATSIMSGQVGTFTVTPDAGYNTAVRGTCGGAWSGNTYTTLPVTSDCTVVFSFARKLVLFVGNSFTFGRIDPVMSYNTADVTDLTHPMWLADIPTAEEEHPGSNPDEPHPWGGIPGVFKKLTDQAGLEYDVSISARNAASLRGHYLNTNPAGWQLRSNIASQRWDTVVLQDLSDQPLPFERGANANLPYFNAYVDKIEAWIHVGAPEHYTEIDLYGGTLEACREITHASANQCTLPRDVAFANANARPGTDVFLYQTWARPDMIGPNGTNRSPATGLQWYSAADGIDAMTADFHASYFGRAAANPGIADVSPVGDAFLRAVQDGVAQRDPYLPPEAGKVNLWHTDFFHPSKYGSYLSALVHFATITGIDPMTLGAGEQAAIDLGIAPGVAAQLQRVARATVMPDNVAPVTMASVSPAPNAQGWNRVPVTVTFAATDNTGGWGLASVSYTLTGAQPGAGTLPSGGSVTIGTEGVTTISYFATDTAGNPEAPRTLTIRIDATAPVITVPASLTTDATSPAGAAVVYSVSAADNSGLAQAVACTPASGSTLGIGSTTISCSATDAAGNTSAASFAVTVRGAPEQTARLVAAILALRGVNVSAAAVNVLAGLLQGALNSGNTHAYCAVLGAFAKHVAMLSGRGIPAATATQLAISASQIRAVLACR